MEPAFEVIGEVDARGPFVLTCEHATNLLPEWRAEPADLPLLRDHWGLDIGAAQLTRILAARTGSCAVLSRFSRLVCDPNRDPGEPSFVVEAIDGHTLSFNRGVDADERRRRRARYFDAYHAAIERTLAARAALPEPVRLCAIHSFTPSWLGRPRPMEVGVLFDAHEEAAWRLQQALEEEGFATAANAPYSGYEGLIYAARRHGRAHGLVYAELEVRQDLIDDDAKAAAVGERVARALLRWTP